jgi:hypothetical protein
VTAVTYDFSRLSFMLFVMYASNAATAHQHSLLAFTAAQYHCATRSGRWANDLAERHAAVRGKAFFVPIVVELHCHMLSSATRRPPRDLLDICYALQTIPLFINTCVTVAW